MHLWVSSPKLWQEKQRPNWNRGIALDASTCACLPHMPILGAWYSPIARPPKKTLEASITTCSPCDACRASLPASLGSYADLVRWGWRRFPARPQRTRGGPLPFLAAFTKPSASFRCPSRNLNLLHRCCSLNLFQSTLGNMSLKIASSTAMYICMPCTRRMLNNESMTYFEVDSCFLRKCQLAEVSLLMTWGSCFSAHRMLTGWFSHKITHMHRNLRHFVDIVCG